MKKILGIILILICSTSSANAINETLPSNFNDWTKYNTNIYFNGENEVSKSNYSDSFLTGYIEKAIKENYSIKIANDKIMQYEYLAKGVNSLRLPWISIQPEANSQRSMSASSGNFYETGFYNLPLKFNWELDIWGKNKLKSKSANFDSLVKNQELNVIKLSVITDISIAYYNLILSDYLVQNTESRIKNLEETAKLKDSLYKNGIINFEEIYLIKNEYTQTLDELNQYKSQREIFLHQIFVLMGEVPVNANNFNRSEISLVNIPNNISLKNSELMMFERPDVIVAKTEAEKARIDVKIAQKELLPSIYLNEIIGLTSLNISDLFNWYSRIYQFGMQLVTDLYTGGYKKSKLNYSKEILNEKTHNYYSVLLNAIKETQDVISLINNDYESYLNYKKIVKDTEQYKELIKVKYDNGLVSKINYLDLERQVYINQKYLNVYKIKVLIDYINLNKSLGRTDL